MQSIVHLFQMICKLMNLFGFLLFHLFQRDFQILIVICKQLGLLLIKLYLYLWLPYIFNTDLGIHIGKLLY